MAQSTDSETQSEQPDPAAQAWLKPEQIEEMRNATVAESADYLAPRNDALIALLGDTGLRVAEAVALDVEMLDLDEGILRLPPEIQKDHPHEDSSPRYVEIELSSDTVRTLRQYLNTRWKESPALFPSRQSERMTTRSVQNVVSNAAEAAEIRPYTVGGRGEPSDVTVHTLRHSVGWRLLNREDKRLYDVRNRLRHATIVTTERVYDHFNRV